MGSVRQRAPNPNRASGLTRPTAEGRTLIQTSVPASPRRLTVAFSPAVAHGVSPLSVPASNRYDCDSLNCGWEAKNNTR